MSSIARTLPRLVRPVAVSARSFHQSARQLDNNPPPTHRAIIVDYDRVPTGFPNPDLKPTPGIMVRPHSRHAHAAARTGTARSTCPSIAECCQTAAPLTVSISLPVCLLVCARAQKLAWASVAFVFATWIYNGFAPKNNHWAGNLGYTDAELKEQKKKKESDNEGE